MKKSGRRRNQIRVPISYQSPNPPSGGGRPTSESPTEKSAVVDASDAQTSEQPVSMRPRITAGSASYAQVARFTIVPNKIKQNATTDPELLLDRSNAREQNLTTASQPSLNQSDEQKQKHTPTSQCASNQCDVHEKKATAESQPSLDQSDVQGRKATTMSQSNPSANCIDEQNAATNLQEQVAHTYAKIATPILQPSVDQSQRHKPTTTFQPSLDQSHQKDVASKVQPWLDQSHNQDSKTEDEPALHESPRQKATTESQLPSAPRHEQNATPIQPSLHQSHKQFAAPAIQPSSAQGQQQYATPAPQSSLGLSRQQRSKTRKQLPPIQTNFSGVRGPSIDRSVGHDYDMYQPSLPRRHGAQNLPLSSRDFPTFGVGHMMGTGRGNGFAMEARQRNFGVPGPRNLMALDHQNPNAGTQDVRRMQGDFRKIHDPRTKFYRNNDQPSTPGPWISRLAQTPLRQQTLFPRHVNIANVNPTSEFPSLSGNVPAQIGSTNAWNGSSLRQRSPERPARGFGRGAGRIQDDAQRSNFAPGAEGYRFGSGQTNSTTNRGTRGVFSAAQASEQEPSGYASRLSAQDPQAVPNNDTATSPAPAPEATSAANDSSHPAPKRISEMTEQEKYGMAGVLAQINANHPDHNPLMAGFDLTKLGVQMDSAEPLMPTWPGPFDEQHLAIPDFTLPSAYTVTNVPPLASKMDSMSDETIMMIFFEKTRDMLQQLAAEMLYKRDWRWHRVMRCWIKQDTSPQGGMYGAPMRLNEKQERGVYILFDLENWRRERKEMVLNYEDLDTRASLLASLAAGTFQGPPGMQLNGQNGSAAQGLGMGGAAGAAFGGAFAQGGMPNV